MSKRKKLVIVIAIALAIACSNQAIKNGKTQKQPPLTEASIPYLPTAFMDMALFPGNVFELFINHL